MRLTILDGHAVNPGDLDWEAFSELADMTVFLRTEPHQVIERIGDSDAVFLNKISITEEILSACPNLKYIGVLATGYNVVDLTAARRHNVTVTNIPAYSTNAVAQHVFAFILHFTNQISAHNQSVQNGDWIRCPDFCYWNSSLTELSGKTLGIFGFGNIGQKVASIATAFGMNILCTSRTKKEGMPPFVPFKTLLEQSDFITLHSPLTAQTEGIINAKTLSLMKKSAVLINTARGGLVVEKDVRYALENDLIAGFGTDVLQEEPMSQDNPLLGCKNCIITPHLAWAPKETRKRLQEIAFENLKAFISGKPINVVS